MLGQMQVLARSTRRLVRRHRPRAISDGTQSMATHESVEPKPSLDLEIPPHHCTNIGITVQLCVTGVLDCASAASSP